MTYDNELTGVIFKTNEKKSEKSPDYWGKCQVQGIEYKFAGWIKEGNKGKYIWYKLTLPEDSYNATTENDDRVPF